LKKITVLSLVAAALLFAIPAQAQLSTNYITNGGFATNSNWTYANSASYINGTEDDPCDFYFGYTMKAAFLPGSYSSVSQTFSTGSHTSWAYNFEVQAHTLAGADYYDELRVLVENLTTGQAEVFFVKPNQMTSTCQRFDVTLTRSYSNANVRITFNSQAFTDLDLYVDNVAFWGQN
jgi:hypothetical protein